MITENNTEILIIDIGQDAIGGLPSLTCHTNLITCCRSADNNGGGGLGEWLFPDGSPVPGGAVAAATDPFARIRNFRQIRLSRREGLGPTGSWCCVIPTVSDGEVTFCANLGELIQ